MHHTSAQPHHARYLPYICIRAPRTVCNCTPPCSQAPYVYTCRDAGATSHTHTHARAHKTDVCLPACNTPTPIVASTETHSEDVNYAYATPSTPTAYNKCDAPCDDPIRATPARNAINALVHSNTQRGSSYLTPPHARRTASCIGVP